MVDRNKTLTPDEQVIFNREYQRGFQHGADFGNKRINAYKPGAIGYIAYESGYADGLAFLVDSFQ